MTEILLVLLGVAAGCGLLSLLWCRLVLPVSGRDLWTVVRAQGDGAGLEQQVRGLVWLHSCGFIRCPVVVADMGLDEQGRALADRLAARWPQVVLCSRTQLAKQFEM